MPSGGCWSGSGRTRTRARCSWAARDLAPFLALGGTHGTAARARFRVGGILGEVGAGLPSVFEVALPAFRAAVARHEGGDAPSFRALAGLMRTVEDTTALHRCGADGLATLRADGARLDVVLDGGGARPAATFLRERNAAYREVNLTMGVVADLLGVAYGGSPGGASSSGAQPAGGDARPGADVPRTSS